LKTNTKKKEKERQETKRRGKGRDRLGKKFLGGGICIFAFYTSPSILPSKKKNIALPIR